MTTLTFRTGSDTHVLEAYPNTPNSDNPYPIMGGATNARKRIFWRPAGLAEALRNQTVLSATMSVPIRGSSATFSPSFGLLDKGYAASVNWTRQPDVLAGAIARQWSAATDGQRVTADITPLVQQVANGQAFYGFRIATTSTTDRRVYGYDSNRESWLLTVVIADDSDAPVALEPDGGSIGVTQPTLAWQADDGEPEAGISGSQVAYRVQVDRPASGASPDGVAPDYDSGTVTSTTSQHPLVGTAFTAASGALTYWRVMTRDAAGNWSDWADWASFTYRPKPTLTFNSPSGSSIFDPSPTIQVTSSLSIVAYQIVVTDAADESVVKYDSGRQGWTDTGTTTVLTEEIPTKRNGSTVFAGSTAGYKITVLIEDRNDRVASPGDPAQTATSRTVTLASGGEPAPTSLTATQEGGLPEVKLRWTRSAAADIWVIERNGSVIAEIESDDSLAEDGPIVPDGAGAWTWLDKYAPPGKEASYTVRALQNGGQQSAVSPAAVVTPSVIGFWLIRPNGQRIVLNGMPDVEQSDRRVTYEGINAQAPFDIIYAQLGISGTFDGFVSLEADQNLDTALSRLRAIRRAPLEWVRAVWGEHNIPVELANVSVVTSPEAEDDAYRKNSRAHRVSFEIRQTGEFETTR